MYKLTIQSFKIFHVTFGLEQQQEKDTITMIYAHNSQRKKYKQKTWKITQTEAPSSIFFSRMVLFTKFDSSSC